MENRMRKEFCTIITVIKYIAYNLLLSSKSVCKVQMSIQ